MNAPQALHRLVSTIAEIDARWDLYGPIIRKLQPMTFAIARKGWPLGGWTIHLCIEDFPRQFMAGIDRFLGVDITWYTRRYRDPTRQQIHEVQLLIRGLDGRALPAPVGLACTSHTE